MTMLRVLLLVIGLHALPAAADLEADRAAGICVEIERNINTLADFTTTRCWPAKDPAGISFIIVAHAPVFTSDTTLKGWLLTVMGATGLALNNRSNFKADRIYISDAGRMKNRRAKAIAASAMKSLQRRVKAGQIGLDAAYAEMIQKMTDYTIPK